MSLSAASVRRGAMMLALAASSSQDRRPRTRSGPRRPRRSRADSLPLSLGDAVRLATSRGEEVRVARTQVDLAETRWRGAVPGAPAARRDVRLPAHAPQPVRERARRLQLPVVLAGHHGSLEERVRYLEKNAPVAPFSALGSLVSGLGIVAPNAYSIGLTGSQTLFAGGRVGAGARARRPGGAPRRTLDRADGRGGAAGARRVLQALLAQEAAVITDSSVAQAERFLASSGCGSRPARAPSSRCCGPKCRATTCGRSRCRRATSATSRCSTSSGW